MKQPRNVIPSTPFSRAFDFIALLSLAASIVLTVWHYGNLPDSVPSHFNAMGTPDAYSSKPIIWILPLISLVTWAGLSWLGRIPQAFNYPVPVTAQNQQRLYTHAAQTIGVLKTVILGQLASLVYFQHQIALGVNESLPGWWLPVTVICVLGTVSWFVVRSFQISQASSSSPDSSIR